MEIQIEEHPKPNSTEINILALAFLGDAVYELYMREKLLESGLVKAAALSKAASGLACASRQAELARRLEPHLNEEEAALLRRGRNAKTRHQPRGDVLEYRMATGLETLLGYLQHYGQKQRLEEVLDLLWGMANDK